MHLGCKRCVELFDVNDVMSLTSYGKKIENCDKMDEKRERLV